MNKSMFTKSFTISIHALREEGDCDRHSRSKNCWNFYPRPPRGGRLQQDAAMSYNSAISIHALREEGDRFFLGCNGTQLLFLSTPSARRATLPPPPLWPDWAISIHALREEGDSKNRDKISIFKQIIQHSARI